MRYLVIGGVGLLAAAMNIEATAQVGRPRSAGAEAPAPSATTSSATASTIDGIVLRRLKQLGLKPAARTTDAVFLRRVYLDVIGTLPTVDEVRAFLDDTTANKRARLIDDLLERDEFADYWSMKWSDLLRVKSEFPINLWPNAVQAYHQWIRASIRANTPYDRFVRELLTSSGSNFRVAPVNFYRAVQSRQPEALASAVALTFMGARTERWPRDRVSNMSVFFSQVGYKPTQEWKEEIVYFDPEKKLPESVGASRTAVLPDGTRIRIAVDQDPRVAFADWLITPSNPWFTKAIANRAWYWLLGRGVIEEPDDIRPDNPASNAALLAYLERELVASRYDLKHLFRLILDADCYQASAIWNGPRTAEADANFAHYAQRPLEAEVLIDAIDRVTGGTEQYASPIPEPFTFVPEDQRSIALADGSITSSFLKTFGRSPRDVGRESERDNRPTAAARLALLNSTQVQQKLEQSVTLSLLIRSRATMPQLMEQLYLRILSRPPTGEEMKAVLAYAQTAGGNRRTAVLDVAWALINTPEFLYRH